MADRPRFQNAPKEYDARDQVELRRAVQTIIQQMQQEILDLQERVTALEPVVP